MKNVIKRVKIRKNYITRIITVILISTLLLSTSACNNSNDKNQNNTTSSTEKADPLGKYNPEITVEMVHQNADQTVKFKDGDSFQNNAYTRAYKDVLGINVNYKWVAYGDDGIQKSKLMIASGDLPDIFMAKDLSEYEQLVKAGKVEDLTEFYNKYASDYTKSIYAGENVRELEAVKRNGKIYGIPWFNTYNAIISMAWVRADWLKNLNLPVPKTSDELFKVAEAFTNQDPDKNGKNDTYGIAMNSKGIDTSYWNIFHSYPDIWLKDSTGKLTYGMYGSASQASATKLGLQQLQKFYKEGVLSKDFATMDDNKLSEDIVSGKTGILFGTASRPYFALKDNVQKDPKADWIPIPQVSIDNKKATVSANPLNIYGIYVVKKGAKNPEALLKMLNFYNNVYNDPKTMTQKDIDTFGPVFKAAPLRLYNPNTAFNDADNLNKAISSNDTSVLTLNQKNSFNRIKAYLEKGDRTGWSDAAYYYGPTSAMAVAQGYVKNGSYVYDQYGGPSTSSFISKQPLITKKWNQVMMNVVTGSDISEFDDFVKNYGAMGGDSILKEANEWYKSNKAKK